MQSQPCSHQFISNTKSANVRTMWSLLHGTKVDHPQTHKIYLIWNISDAKSTNVWAMQSLPHGTKVDHPWTHKIYPIWNVQVSKEEATIKLTAEQCECQSWAQTYTCIIQLQCAPLFTPTPRGSVQPVTSGCLFRTLHFNSFSLLLQSFQESILIGQTFNPNFNPNRSCDNP